MSGGEHKFPQTGGFGKLRPGEVRERVGGEQGGRRCVPCLLFSIPRHVWRLCSKNGDNLTRSASSLSGLGQCFASGVRWERGQRGRGGRCVGGGVKLVSIGTRGLGGE